MMKTDHTGTREPLIGVAGAGALVTAIFSAMLVAPALAAAPPAISIPR